MSRISKTVGEVLMLAGFAVVGDYESSTIRDAQSKAFQQSVNWLNAH